MRYSRYRQKQPDKRSNQNVVIRTEGAFLSGAITLSQDNGTHSCHLYGNHGFYGTVPVGIDLACMIGKAPGPIQGDDIVSGEREGIIKGDGIFSGFGHCFQILQGFLSGLSNHIPHLRDCGIIYPLDAGAWDDIMELILQHHFVKAVPLGVNPFTGENIE